MEEMFRTGEIDRWWEADIAKVAEVMAVDIGSLFQGLPGGLYKVGRLVKALSICSSLDFL